MFVKSFLLRGVAPVWAAPGEDGTDAPPPADALPPADDAPPADAPPADAPPADTPPADTPPADATDWKDRELRRKHAQIQEAKRREAEKDAEIESLRALVERRAAGGEAPPADDAPPARPAAPGAPPQDAVLAAAQQLRARERFDEESTKADQEGVKRYGADGWAKATDQLKLLGGFDQEGIQQVLATDDPAQVIHTLGSKPEEYQRIMGLPPHKRFAEMIKLALPKPKPATPKPSDAPPPVDPVRGRNVGDPNELKDDLDDETWYARRARQKAARFAARQGAAR